MLVSMGRHCHWDYIRDNHISGSIVNGACAMKQYIRQWDFMKYGCFKANTAMLLLYTTATAEEVGAAVTVVTSSSSSASVAAVVVAVYFFFLSLFMLLFILSFFFSHSTGDNPQRKLMASSMSTKEKGVVTGIIQTS